MRPIDGYQMCVTRRLWLALVCIAAGPLLTGCVVAGGYSNTGGGGGSVFFLLVPLVAFLFIVFTLSRAGRRRRRRHDRSLTAANPQMVRAELSVLADDVLRLEPQVALRPDARGDFEAAVHRYRVAQSAIDHVQTADDLVRVQRVVDEATWAMARARAIIDGRKPPEPPPHLRRRGPRGEPAIELDDGDAPTYVGSRAPFRSGWFGGGGGLLGGMFFGPLIGGFGGWVVKHDDDDRYDESDETDDRYDETD